ncbi:MAG: DUF3540 domain-containing protein [Planctomycetes bacterium]|nr:DUF3540 domain-containing protein [Planctomycetota bacterium]
MFTDTTTSLGPATVAGIDGDRVRLERPCGDAWARLALAYPYHPEPGDVVLAIGEEDVYVIGVLSGRGRTLFEAPGDLEIRARGKVGIVAGDEVSVRGPRVSLEADLLETVAGSSLQRLINEFRWVKESTQTHAGRVRTVVEGTSTLHAERVVETAEKDVKIDGRNILLG